MKNTFLPEIMPLIRYQDIKKQIKSGILKINRIEVNLQDLKNHQIEI